MGFEVGDGPSDLLYGNVFGFLRAPLSHDFSAADIVVAGVNLDVTTSGRPGARYGPAAIRSASAQLAWEERRWPWSFAWREVVSLVDVGDVEFRLGDVDDLMRVVQEHATRVLDAQKFPLTFGGDHFVSLPLLRAQAARHGSVALVHFDAHTDTESSGALNHGTMFHHARRDGLVDAEHSVQIGIRTEWEHADHGFTVLDAAACNDAGAAATVGRIRDVVGDRPVYVTFDVDFLDPAFAPGTGTPVAGGLSTDFALKALRGLSGLRLVGADIVEVAPAYDVGEVTALAAATAALEIVCVLAQNRLESS